MDGKGLLIHDLSEKEWTAISQQYEGWDVIADNGWIRPCIGCFSCWYKTPGECILDDGYGDMAMRIHRAGEVVVMSRYTYGGLSGFVKNVIDRSISYVQPVYEVCEDEMLHLKRFDEELSLTFIFRGNGITDENKKKTAKYVEALSRNMRGRLRELVFEECDWGAVDGGLKNRTAFDRKKAVTLNCSLRGKRANSKKFLDRLTQKLDMQVEALNISDYYPERMAELEKLLMAAGVIIIGAPMYTDGIPSVLLRLMEKLEKEDRGGGKYIYSVFNMGLYESRRLWSPLWMMKNWCDRCGYTYGGSVAIGAGEMIRPFMDEEDIEEGPARNASHGLDELAASINELSVAEDNYAEVYLIPRFMYISSINSKWSKIAGKKEMKVK